jgi:hypothetical protein
VPTHTPVWIDRETADIALTELQTQSNPAATDLTPGDIDQAMDDLNGALTADPPRTRLKRRGEIEACQIPGVPADTVAIDYQHDPPQLLVHADNEEEPTHVITLPSTETPDPLTAQDTNETPADQPADESVSVSLLIAQLRAGERALVDDATVSIPEPELIELTHQASDGAVILQFDYGRSYRTDINEMFDYLL